MIFASSAVASTGAVMRASPAFGVFDVSSVLIGGKLHALQQVVIGCPYPAFADGKPGEAVIDPPRLVAVGVAVHPCLDRVAVLRAE